MERLKFSGHETFICKQLWPKKGYDFILEGNYFNENDAVVKLGVGKNMVSSIRFWLSALGITDKKENLSEYAKLIFDDKGYDPYIEDIGTIWVLHYHLVTKNFASIYQLIHNSFLKGKSEFTKASLLSFINRVSIDNNGCKVNSKTLQSDISVFFRNYLIPDKGNNYIEEEYSGLFYDLKLLKKYSRNTFENRNEEYFIMQRDKRNSLPKEIFLYAILENHNYGNSISLNELVAGYNSVGNIFLLSREDIYNKIKEITEAYEFVEFSQTAGVSILQLIEKPRPIDILKMYYEN